MQLLLNLEQLMAEYRINRSELARACNLSTSTVNSWWNRSCEMLEMGIYTLEKYQSRVNILEQEKKALHEQINALNNNDIDKVKQVKLAVPILERCIASYWTLEAKQKNDLLKSIIDKIEYSKSTKWFQSADDMHLKIYLKI